MDCKVHAAGHLLCGAQGNKIDAQADDQGLKGCKKDHALLEEVEGFEATSGRQWISFQAHAS